MKDQHAALNRQTARRFFRAVKDLLTSEVRRPAYGWLALLLVFALSVSGLNVINSYVGRDFMTAIAHRDSPGFVKLAILYVGVFAATTFVAVLYRFAEERLGLLWRSWLTRRVTEGYMNRRTFYRLKESGTIENPDQRMTDDIRAFTTTTLSFSLIVLNATLAAISFSGVLWAISPLLFIVAVGYAAVGTFLTIFLGRPLVWLNYSQSDREADFRAALIHVGENAESIAIFRQESRLKERLLSHIDGLVDNFRKITSVNRNLGFFTTGYNYLIQVIPVLIVAPQFINGEIEFGVITQSTMAFAQLLGAFSVIVNQFGSISIFAAVIARLGALAEAVETTHGEKGNIELREDPQRIAFEQLTLQVSADEQVLVDKLAFSIPRGQRVLIAGSNEAARVALFKALAGTWPGGTGRIVRPPLDAVMFLAQRPYLPPGTLRQILLPPGREHDVNDDEIRAAFNEAGSASILDRAGGLDVEVDWSSKLSLSEQQLLLIVRIMLARPTFAVLDRASTALGKPQLGESLRQLSAREISYIVLEESLEGHELFDSTLEIGDHGGWQITNRS